MVRIRDDFFIEYIRFAGARLYGRICSHRRAWRAEAQRRRVAGSGLGNNQGLKSWTACWGVVTTTS